MEKLLRCSDLGTDCGFEACGDTAEEVLKTLLDHARAIHGLKDIPEKDLVRLRETVQQAFCAPKEGITLAEGNFVLVFNEQCIKTFTLAARRTRRVIFCLSGWYSHHSREALQFTSE